jgi:hypothetical protein
MLLLPVVSCVSSRQSGKDTEANMPVAIRLDSTQISKYRVSIKVKQTETTGIMVWKYIDKEWRGSLMNEMGVKVFDFVASPGKCHLQNTISFLDKWYIRRTIESDLSFLFWKATDGKSVKGKSLQVLPEGAFILKNEKRNIEYSFQPFEQ